MAGVNKVILVGHLGKDPEVRTLENGAKVASFSLATSESYKDKNTGEKIENVEWHNIVLWRGLADVAERFLAKGSLVYIEGKISTRSYEKDGITRYRTDIVGRDLTMLGKKGEQGNTNYTPPQAQASTMAPPEHGEDDDLPF